MQETHKTTGAKHTYRWLWWVLASLCGFVALVSVMDLAWPGFIGGTTVWSDSRRIIGPLASILLTAGFAALACDVDVMGYLKRNYNKGDRFGVTMGWTRMVVVVVGWTAIGVLTLVLLVSVTAKVFFPTSLASADGWLEQFADSWLRIVAVTIVTAGVFYRTYCATWGRNRWGWDEWARRGKRLLVEVVKSAPWVALGYLASTML